MVLCGASSLNSAFFFFFIFIAGYKLSCRLHRIRALPFTPLSVFTNTWQKLGQRFWCELHHLTSQPTFAAAYKGLSFWITFLPLWQISVPAEHFHSINLLFLCSPSTIRYGTSFLRISNFNLVKKCTDWTMSAVPTISWLTECLHRSLGLLPIELQRIGELDRWCVGTFKSALTHAHARMHTLYRNTLARSRGANYAICDKKWL